MKILTAIGFMTALAAVVNPSFAMKCSKPPEQVARTIKNDAELSIKVLKNFLGEAGFGSKTRVVVDNLYEKYPNADKIVIAQLLLSQLCSLLDESRDLSSERKIELFSETRDQILKLATAVPDSQEKFTVRDYLMEIQWRVSMASDRVDLGISRNDPRTAAREAWQALNGEQPKLYRSAIRALSSWTLMELIGEVMKLSSDDKKQQIKVAYDIAIKMAEVGPTLLDDKPLNTSKEKEQWKRAFLKFACDPNKSRCKPKGLWPQFKQLNIWDQL